MDNKNARRNVVPPPSWMARRDGRLKILLTLAACLVTQYIPESWFPVWLAALALLFFCHEMRTRPSRSMLRGGASFIAFWLMVKAGSDCVGGASLGAALLGAVPFALRLAALTLVGTAFTALSSPVETGKSVAWFIRPVLGDRAWMPALSVALVAWFLPQALRLPGRVSAAARARGLALPWRRRLLLLVGTTLRILCRAADSLAVGIASRRLDHDAAWRCE